MAKIAIIPYFELITPRVQNEIEALIKAGHDVTVFNWTREGTYQKISDSFEFEVERISLSAPGKGLSSLLFLPFYYLKLIKRLVEEDFDVLHCTYFMLLPLCLLFKDRAKIVYDAREAHPMIFSKHFPAPISNLSRKITEIIENWMVKHVDLVLTVDTFKNFLEKRFLEFNENVQILFNVPKSVKEPDRSKVKEIEKKYRGKKIIAYVGGISKEKGLMKALETVEILRKRYDVKLLLIGEFKDSKKEASEFIRRKKLNKNVETISWLPFEEMLSYLHVADIGLALHQPTEFYKSYPSKGTGRKFFTYMQVGLPIVGPEFAEVGKVVRDEGCGVLVDTTNADEIAKAIKRLLDNPEEANEMGEKGRKAIENKYNWKVEKEKFLKAYEEMVNQG